jgi:beta-glucosidase-like glycosyl hydrolase
VLPLVASHTKCEATSYPQGIALSSAWHPMLVHEVFTSVAAEVRARGAQECLPGAGAGPCARTALEPHR